MFDDYDSTVFAEPDIVKKRIAKSRSNEEDRDDENDDGDVGKSRSTGNLSKFSIGPAPTVVHTGIASSKSMASIPSLLSQNLHNSRSMNLSTLSNANQAGIRGKKSGALMTSINKARGEYGDLGSGAKYDPGMKLIEVVEYNLKPPTNQIVDCPDQLEYRFSVFNAVTGKYQTSHQAFFGKDPTGLQWNPMDQYIAEDEDSRQATPQLKLKRLIFGVLPLNPPVDAYNITAVESGTEATRIDAIQQFLYACLFLFKTIFILPLTFQRARKSIREKAVKFNGKNSDIDLAIGMRSLQVLGRVPGMNSPGAADEDHSSVDNVSKEVNTTTTDDDSDLMHSFNIGNLGYSKAKQLGLEVVDIPHYAYDPAQGPPLPSLAYPWATSVYLNDNFKVRRKVAHPLIGGLIETAETW
ncbi:unnamed protein product [Sphagnum tenellum]